MSKRIVLSSAPALLNFMGHSYNYHSAVNTALKLSHFEYRVLIPKSHPLTYIEDFWEPNLVIPNLHVGSIKSSFCRAYYYVSSSFTFAFSWLFFFRKYYSKNNCIIFFETGGSFLNEMMASIFLLIFSRKRPISIIYLIRTLPETFKFQVLMKLSIYFTSKLVKTGQLKLLADTEPLAEKLSQFLGDKVICIPIPHGCNQRKNLTSDVLIAKDATLRIWGLSCLGSKKGEKYLVKLLNESNLRLNVKVLVRQTFCTNNDLSENPNLEILANSLSESDFYGAMETCRFALLPYFGGVADGYKLNSSGIFIDAIGSGVIPFVSIDTWMAYEYIKFDLHDFILDWDEYSTLTELINDMCGRAQSDNLDKFSNMQKCYRSYHSPKSFVATLENTGCFI